MPRRNILWISLESFRWDHTGFADHVRDTTSNLENLVSAGAFCSNNCYSHGIYTRSSTASILTGRPPSNHGVGMYRTQIPESISTVPEQLSPEGYWNVCISPNGHISQATSLNRGFDEFRFITGSTISSEVPYPVLGKYLLNLFEHSGGLTTKTSHHSISYLNNELAKGYVDRAATRDDSMFLYLHYGDSHHPYVPPVAWRETFQEELALCLDEAISLASYMKRNLLEEIAQGCSFDGDEWNDLLVLYDTLLAYVDHMVGRLVSYAKDALENPIIVITGDHGENFGEQGLLGHRLKVTRPLVHVPMVVDGLEIPAEADDLMQHADVWRSISKDIEADLTLPGAVDHAETSRKFAVAQMGGDRCEQNLDEIMEYNPDFDRGRFIESDVTALIADSYIYRRSDGRIELCFHKGSGDSKEVDDPEIESRFDSWYREWIENVGAPVQKPGEADDRDVDQHVKDNLENMGYLVE